MKRHSGSSFSGLRVGLAAASVLALALIGCGGGGNNNHSSSSDGGDGGDNGGTTPTSGVAIEGDPGSAIVLPTNPTVNADAIVGKNAVLDMSQTASYENGKLTVHFFLKDEDGNGISLTENSCYFRGYVSQLTTAPGPEDPGPGWHQLDNDSANGGELDMLPGLLTVIDGTTGEYSYTFADDGNTGRHEYPGGGIAAAMADPTNTLRATLVTSCSVEIDGEDYVTVNPANGSYDFSTGAPGTELTDSGAEIVSSAACFTCHGPTLAGFNDSGLDQETDHGRYTAVETCNQCHALNSYVSNQNADLAPFIHSIHSGQPSQANLMAENESWGLYQSGHDFAGEDFGPVDTPRISGSATSAMPTAPRSTQTTLTARMDPLPPKPIWPTVTRAAVRAVAAIRRSISRPVKATPVVCRPSITSAPPATRPPAPSPASRGRSRPCTPSARRDRIRKISPSSLSTSK